jgi:hypothetical protein
VPRAGPDGKKATRGDLRAAHGICHGRSIAQYPILSSPGVGPARQLWMELSVAPVRPASRAKRGGLEGRPGPFGGFAPSFASPNYRCSGTPWAGDWQRGAAAPFATSGPAGGASPGFASPRPPVPWRRYFAEGVPEGAQPHRQPAVVQDRRNSRLPFRGTGLGNYSSERIGRP